MANAQTMKVWRIDTEGILYTRPVAITRVVLYPSAAGDAATLASWDESATKKATMANKTVTTTLTTTITSTGNFETAEVAVNDIIRITQTSTGKNIGYYQVGTRSSDDEIIVDSANALTNEASKVYSWWTLTPQTVIPLLAQATEKAVEYAYDGLLRLPNLAISGISASAVVYIYLA